MDYRKDYVKKTGLEWKSYDGFGFTEKQFEYLENRLSDTELKLQEAEAQNKKLLALFECGVNSQDGFGNYIIDADEADEIIKEENKGCYKCGCTKVDWGDNLNHGGYATCKECGEPLTSK